jgi:hydroxylamine reductase (hybrid-cluster protein)
VRRAKRRESWSWSDAARRAGERLRTASAEGRGTPTSCHEDIATQPAKETKRARKGRAEEAIKQPAQLAPLAALAKIAESEGWMMDEALAEAVNALSQRLYGKPAL